MVYAGQEYRSIVEAPKGADTAEGLAALGKRVADEVLAGKRQMEDAKKTLYDRLWGLYLHDVPVPKTPAFNGASNAHLNVMQVKCDALGTNVLRTMMSRTPYCVAFCGFDEGRVRRNAVAERCVQFFVDKGLASHAIASVSVDMALINAGYVYTRFVKKGDGFDPTPGIEFCPIEFYDFFVYPASVVSQTWQEPVKSCGHRVWYRKSTVESMKKKGEWADVPTGSDLPEAVRGDATPSVTKTVAHDTAGDTKNELVPLWWTCFKDFDASGEDVLWWGLLSEYDKQFLCLNRHKEPRPPYHTLRYKENKGQFYSQSSVGNDLQGVQLEIDNLLRMWLDGTKWNIYGSMVGPSFGRAEQSIKYGPGEMVLTDEPSSVQYFNPKADLGYVPNAIEFLLNYADQIVRIPQESSGGGDPNSTATSSAIRHAGMKVGVDDYIATAYLGMVSIYEYVHALLVNNIDSWWEPLSVFLGLTDDDRAGLLMPCLWQPHTEGIGSTPAHQVQILQMVSEYATINQGAGLDSRKLMEFMLQQAERMGIAGASEMQLPEDPKEMIAKMSKMFGIDTLILSDAIRQAERTQQLAMEGQQNQERTKIAQAVADGMGGVPVASGKAGIDRSLGRKTGGAKGGA